MNVTAAPPATAAIRGAWTPIKQALYEGPPGPVIEVNDPREAEEVASALRAACTRSPWLLSLAVADPHRLLRAAGITLEGAAHRAFDQRRRAEGWEERPAEFERVASAPARLATKGLAMSGVASSASPGLAGDAPTAGTVTPSWTLGTAVERLQTLGTSVLSTSPSSSGQASPVISPTEAGHSHSADVDYMGITIPWDAVIQLHESFLKRQYDVLFATQVIAALFGGSGSDDVIDFRFTFESWLFLFIRCDLVIDVLDEPGEVTLAGAGADEVGVRFRFTATSYSRWTPDDEWSQTDEFSGTFTRYGTLVKQTPIALAGTTFRRTWAADLANGWTAIELDDGADEGRELLLDSAVRAYMAAELPLLPVTPTFPVDKPLMTYPTSAAFTSSGQSDLRAVSLCFHEDASSLIAYPFRNYILDHGRNLAIGISISALSQEVLGGLDLPISDGSITVETVTITGGFGRLHIRSEGKGPLGVRFSHTADILLSLKNGGLVAEVDDSTLNLPWWLWALNALLLVPLYGVGGLIPLAIANVIGSTVVGNTLEGLIDLGALENATTLDETGSGVTTKIERVEVNPFGVFLKGNIEINTSELL